MKPFLLSFSAIALLAALSSSFAGATIYKGLDSQGRVSYSDDPKALKNPKKIEPSRSAIEGTDPYVSAPIVFDIPAAVSPPPSGDPQATPSDSQSRLQEALANLERAQAAAKAGSEPLPAESAAMEAPSDSRDPEILRRRDEYFLRQKALSQAVEDAKRSIEEILSDPNR